MQIRFKIATFAKKYKKFREITLFLRKNSRILKFRITFLIQFFMLIPNLLSKFSYVFYFLRKLHFSENSKIQNKVRSLSKYFFRFLHQISFRLMYKLRNFSFFHFFSHNGPPLRFLIFDGSLFPNGRS